jgi:hypothetical protein
MGSDMQHQDTVATTPRDPRVDTQGFYFDVGTTHCRTVDRTVIFDFDGTIADI